MTQPTAASSASAAKVCLVIAAHPDDIESWCAGSVLCTSGEKGTADPAEAPAVVAARREAEQRAAARCVGAQEPVFLRLPDGGLEDDAHLRGLLVRAIRRHRPALLLTHDPVHPWPPYTAHRDHRIAGRVALDAAYPYARDPLHFAEQVRVEGLRPHAVPEVWLFCSDVPDHYVDIAAGLDAKIAARLAHVSQTADPAALAASWRARAAETGRASPAGIALAEAFKRLTL
ncbi:MAG: PIG-L deacetylase family protein [Ktedonobacterales bacterium]